jgi:hypothetical protein
VAAAKADDCTVTCRGATPARRTALGSAMSGSARRITAAATSKISAALR